MSAPLRQVLDSVEAGATTRAAIAERTGLDPDVVDGAVDHLLRLGRIAAPSLRDVVPGRRVRGLRHGHRLRMLSSRSERAGTSDGPYQVSSRPLTSAVRVFVNASGPSSAVKT